MAEQVDARLHTAERERASTYVTEANAADFETGGERQAGATCATTEYGRSNEHVKRWKERVDSKHRSV